MTNTNSKDVQVFVGFIALLGAIAIISTVFLGCDGMRDPRVVQCDKCGKVQGRIGGLLPGQGSRCSCGGTITTRRRMTGEQWREAQQRGYVTLDDGEPSGGEW